MAQYLRHGAGLGSRINLVFLGILGLGCGTTTIREQRIIQARAPGGEVAYYRLRIEGDAKLAKSHFRAGLYDAEAIDSLIVGTNGSSSLSNETATQQIEAERRKAVIALARKYTDELLANGDNHEVIAQRLLHAVQSTYRTPDGDVTYKPEKKYVIIFSAIASVVEEAIASFADEKETQQLVVASVASGRRTEFLKESSRAEELRSKAESLDLLREALEKLPAFDPKDTAEARAKYLTNLRQMVEDIQTITGAP